MPKNLAWTHNIGGLNVTFTSQVVVYTPAERADTVHSFFISSTLSSSVVCPTSEKRSLKQTQLYPTKEKILMDFAYLSPTNIL
jgi:hypothetical protein